MPRQIIYFSDATLKRLNAYVAWKYPGKKALSLVVEEALKRYLDEVGLDVAVNSATGPDEENK